jgi:N-hydroxyarylamine O-acetyltransferase
VRNTDIQKYFSRIGYAGDTRVSASTLAALHTAHAFTIPFENLDVKYGRTLSLDPDALFDKLVTRRRGGYCFEMNGLFSIALKTLGFNVKNLLARTAFGDAYSAKSHEVLAVDIDGVTYLADVGYGNDGIAAPLILQTGAEQTQFGNVYSFAQDPTFGWVLRRREGDAFTPMYAFTTDECLPVDFEVANHFTATHPSSFFKTTGFVTKPTETGRVTLTEAHLKITDSGSVSERDVTDERDFAWLLREYFSLNLDEIVPVANSD